jgi:hypothetical protein
MDTQCIFCKGRNWIFKSHLGTIYASNDKTERPVSGGQLRTVPKLTEILKFPFTGSSAMLQAGRSRVRFPMRSLSLEPQYGPGVDSSSKWNEYQESSCG